MFELGDIFGNMLIGMEESVKMGENEYGVRRG